MSGFAAQRRRRSSREGGRLRDPADREGSLRVGAADERLDTLIEEAERAPCQLRSGELRLLRLRPLLEERHRHLPREVVRVVDLRSNVVKQGMVGLPGPRRVGKKR